MFPQSETPLQSCGYSLLNHRQKCGPNPIQSRQTSQDMQRNKQKWQETKKIQRMSTKHWQLVFSHLQYKMKNTRSTYSTRYKSTRTYLLWHQTWAIHDVTNDKISIPTNDVNGNFSFHIHNVTIHYSNLHIYSMIHLFLMFRLKGH